MQEDESSAFSNAYVALWKKYDARLRRIHGKISNTVRQILSSTELHAACFSSISVRQTKALRPLGYRHKRRVDIIITLHSAPSLNKIYIINYSGVTKYIFDFPTDDPLDYLCDEGLDSWGYDELSLSYGKLKHEILFHSGGLITIVFDKLSVKKCSSPV
jgi:hypothetical protein